MSQIQRPSNFQQNLIKVQEYTPISYLASNISNWIIKARVTKISPMKNFAGQYGDGCFFNIDLIGKNSQEISATFFNDAAEKFKDTIKLGKIFTFSKGKIKKTKPEYGNQFGISLTFDIRSEIVEVQEEDRQIPYNNFNLLKISQIQSLKDETLVDFSGIVTLIGEPYEFQRKNGQIIRKKNITIVDDSGFQLDLVLWGPDVDKYEFKVNKVIVIKKARLSSFKGLQSVAIHFQSMVYQLSQHIQESVQLQKWWDNLENKDISQFQVAKTGSQNRESNTERTLVEIEQECIQNMNNSEFRLWSDIKCDIQHVRSEGTIYYLSCPGEGCARRAIYDEASKDYKCIHCVKNFQEPATKYVTGIKIQDHSGALWCNVYDNIASEIFSINAEGAKLLKEEGSMESLEKLKKLLNECVGKQYKFKLSSKIEIYDGNPNIKHQIYKLIEKPAPAKEAQDIVQMINDIEQEEEEEKQQQHQNDIINENKQQNTQLIQE